MALRSRLRLTVIDAMVNMTKWCRKKLTLEAWKHEARSSVPYTCSPTQTGIDREPLETVARSTHS